MKATNLMLGDWVKNTEFDKDEIDRIEIIEPTRVWLEGNKTYIPLCYIKPIPLTPEILEKNGFESQHNVGYVLEHYDDYTIIVDLWNHTLKILMNYKVVFEKEYFDTIPLHELQHALKLCCIEKEIEL